MAKKSVRRYFGRRGRRGSGKVTIPIMGVLSVTALAGGLATNPAGYPRNAVDYLLLGKPGSAGLTMLKASTDVKSYIPAVAPIAIWLVGRALLGKRKITKRISLF